MTQSDPFSASVIPFEVPEQMRAFAERGVSQARDNYAKFKDAAETHNGTIEAVFSAYAAGAKEYSAKVMEMMKEAASANLDLAQALIGVKSPSEAMELLTSHTRKSFESFTAHSKELAELAQKVATDSAEPIKVATPSASIAMVANEISCRACAVAVSVSFWTPSTSCCTLMPSPTLNLRVSSKMVWP